VIEYEPRGRAHDEDRRQRAYRLGGEHEDFVSPLGYVVLASFVLRVLIDQARGAVGHPHAADQVNIAGGRREPAIASGQCRTGPGNRIFGEEVAGKGEAEQQKHAAGPYHSEQRMYEKKDTEEERSPERVKQHRASVGVDKLAQDGEIPIHFRCPRRIAPEGAFEAGREHGRTKPVFEPGTEPAQ